MREGKSRRQDREVSFVATVSSKTFRPWHFHQFTLSASPERTHDDGFDVVVEYRGLR